MTATEPLPEMTPEEINAEANRVINSAREIVPSLADLHLEAAKSGLGARITVADDSSLLDFDAEAAPLGHNDPGLAHALSMQAGLYAHLGSPRHVLQRIQVEYPLALAKALEAEVGSPVWVQPLSSVAEADNAATSPFGRAIVMNGDPMDNRPDKLPAYVDEAVGTGDVGSMLIHLVSDSGTPIDPEYLSTLHSSAEKHEIPVIYDESLTGFGRTGSLLAQSQSPYRPSMTILGAAGGGGMPFAALFGPKDAGEPPTFDLPSLSPMAMAGGLATLERLGERIYDNVAARSDQLTRETAQLIEQFEFVHDMRAVGLLAALRLDSEKRAKQMVTLARKRGLLTSLATSDPRAIRLLPPLTVTEDDISAAVDVLFECCQEIAYGGR